VWRLLTFAAAYLSIRFGLPFPAGHITMLKAKHTIIGSIVAAVVMVFFLSGLFDISYLGHLEGFYVVKGQMGAPLQLTDDVYLGEEDSVIAGVDFAWFYSLFRLRSQQGRPHLEVSWNEDDGVGFVRNYLGGEKVLMTSFSRYLDSNNQYTHGLFIGGALPDALLDGSKNNSGMSYFDGQRWSHIWCNTNEGIGSTVTPHRYAPSMWRFLGSRIVSQSDQHLVLTSDHEVEVDGVLLRMERRVEMTAGMPDLKLTVRIANPGKGVGRYYYYYGDEPWLGDFGNARGDIGWVDGRMIEYEEIIDPKKVSFAGMADFGSSVLGEGHDFGRAANFIAWLGPDKPDIVFFANQYDGFAHDPLARVPLQGEGRSIGMYWGPRTLTPGQHQLFTLAIGMAEQDPATGRPHLPASISFATAVPRQTGQPRKS
jgi:hypothetical protein